MAATNLTLSLDPSPLPPGYTWPSDTSHWLSTRPHQQPPWVAAVIAVSVAVAASGAVGGGYLIWRRRRANALTGFDRQCSSGSRPGSYPRQSSDGYASQSSKPGSGAQSALTRDGRLAAAARSEQEGGTGTLGSLSYLVLPVPGAPDHALLTSELAAKQQQAVSIEAAAGRQADSEAPGGAGLIGVGRASAGRQQEQCGDVARMRDAAPQQPDTSMSLQDSVAAGMQRWRAAVSSTTMLLMERRMEAAAVQPPSGSGASSSSNVQGLGSVAAAAATAVAADAAPARPLPTAVYAPAGSSGAGPAAAAGGSQLHLGELLGAGSFGSVYLAMWRGKKVAVKVMQLPANAMFEPQLLGTEAAAAEQPGRTDSAELRRRRRVRQQQQNSSPHMAIMEAVLSSTMSHPNCVQVSVRMDGVGSDRMDRGLAHSALSGTSRLSFVRMPKRSIPQSLHSITPPHLINRPTSVHSITPQSTHPRCSRITSTRSPATAPARAAGWRLRGARVGGGRLPGGSASW